MKIIVSLTTYPKRFDCLVKSIHGIVSQTYYDKVDIFYINVDDNLTEDDYSRYETLKRIDSKIQIKICPAKWKSCNKLVWVYKDHPDDMIICFDDDKYYPSETIERLYKEWEKHKNCIVAYEINPIIMRPDGKVYYLNSIDAMMLQVEYGKYLSNACLFPPNSFTDLLFNYDEMMYITNGHHDELWFWIVSTLKGVPCIGLDYTFSLSIDEGVQLCNMESDLTNINADANTIEGYNVRLNERYGKQLSEILLNNPVKFYVTHSSVLKLTGNIGMINALYGNFPIHVICDNTVSTSWISYISRIARQYKWRKFGICIGDKYK